MLKSGEFRILWKTNCKWKDTDYIVKRGDVKPINCSTNDDFTTVKISEGDRVRVKYGERWYNAEVAEVGEEKSEEDPYIEFTAQQAKRELEWKENREEKRRKIGKKEDDNVLKIQSATTAADKIEQQLSIKTNECETLRKRVDQLEEKHDNALNLAKIIGEMNSNMLKSFEKIEKRLEAIEMSLKSQATMNSTFDDITELNLSESGHRSSQNVNANNESTWSTIDIDYSANPTINYLHFFLENHGFGETDVHFHADNCGGQNKNNFFLWYLAWRVISDLHDTIKYSFLLTGHTKFAPDRYFGLLKKAYRASYVSSLYELGSVVETSSNVGVNKAQLVGTHNGKIIVKTYDWATSLGQFFRKIPGITKYHHFRFSKEEPGAVYCKEFVTSVECKFSLLKKEQILPPPILPPEVIPEGLDAERKRYLFNEIRQFCKAGTEDLVAPQPDLN